MISYRTPARAFLLCLLSGVAASILLIAGCGYVRFPHTASDPTATADFSIAVSPSSASTSAGTPAPPLDVTIVPSGGFKGAVAVSLALPTSFTCVPSTCAATLPTYNAPAVLQVTPGGDVPSGTYALTITATSGTLRHTALTTLRITAAAPDFVFTVTPQQSTVAAGTSAPAYSFTATPMNGFTGTIGVVATAPSGWSCAPVSCGISFTESAPQALTLFVPPGTSPGSYQTLFTATSGGLTHTATASIIVPPPTTVAQPFAEVCAAPLPVLSPSTARTGFAYTGDPNPGELLYDSAHDRILVSNLQLNEVDVVSPETMVVTARLPVPQPMGIDLSFDGKTVIIGTRTRYFYRATSDTLCLTDRQYLSASPFTFERLSPMYPTALADGSILFAAYAISSTAQGVFLWNDGAGFTRPAGLGYVLGSVRQIVRSGDRMHAFISGDDSGGDYARYDVGGGGIATRIDFGSQPSVLAVNRDGSKALILSGCCKATLTDGNFNPLTVLKGPYIEGAIAERDFTRFYIKDITSAFTSVYDASLQPVGSIATPLHTIDFDRAEFRAFDGSHRILSLASNGIAFFDLSKLGPVLSPRSTYPILATCCSISGAFNPSTPTPALSTHLNGGNFLSSPSVTLAEGNDVRPAVGASTISQNIIDLTVPSFPSGCADVTVSFPDASSTFAPVAFCYSPSIYVVDGDSGASTGGSTLTLYGLGFGSQTPSVTIGGATSASVASSFANTADGPIAFTALRVKVPPGTPGDADITVSTSFGSATLVHAFHYVQRVDTPLSAGAKPAHLLLDAVRRRILLTDSAHNQLLVYSLASGALLQTISTGPNPQGMSLTPDGTLLLLLTAGDYKVSVLDADGYTTVRQATVPSTVAGFFGPPIVVQAMRGNKAYILAQAGYLQTAFGPYSYPALFDYDLSLNSVTPDIFDTQHPLNEGFTMSASADGSLALIDARLSTGVGNALTDLDIVTPGFGDAAVAPDGHVASLETFLFDHDGRWQNSLTADALRYPSRYSSEPFVAGAQFNGTGSLLYRATPTHLRIYDVRHGTLIRTLEVPDGLRSSNAMETTPAARLLGVDPAGRQVVAVTGAGLSIFTATDDPLSIAQAEYDGTTLTLLGSGFSPASQIKVDGTDVSSNFVSAMGVTVHQTFSTGTHSVTVTNSGGETYTLALAFTSM